MAKDYHYKMPDKYLPGKIYALLSQHVPVFANDLVVACSCGEAFGNGRSRSNGLAGHSFAAHQMEKVVEALWGPAKEE